MYKASDIIAVCIPLKIEGSYYYSVPEGLTLQKGDIVVVPLRNKEVQGVVYNKVAKVDFDLSKLKKVIKKIDNVPAIRSDLIDFLTWLADYNMANFGKCLKMAMNIAGINFSNNHEIISLNLNVELKNITRQRQQIVDILKEGSTDRATLVKNYGVSTSVINTMIKNSSLLVESMFVSSSLQNNMIYTPVQLLEEQLEVTNKLNDYFKDSAFKVAVLQGLPGSGKTEVYFGVVDEVLKKNKQVLILLPEIGISTQIVERFTERFGVSPYVWHSDIGSTSKKDTWISAGNGNLKVIIGARSALFLPFKDLGLIIVDEEHDGSYKQEEGVIYNARDMSIVRAKITNIPVILSSATPSLESMNNVNKGKYELFKLYNRYNQMQMPTVELVDMRKQKLKRNTYLSSSMLDKVQQTLDKKEQSLLFINKRGYANCVVCKSCGEKIECKNCSVALVEHRTKGKLICHYCGYSVIYPNNCPHCSTEDSLVSVGVGVERIFDEVQSRFPDKRIVVLSSDTINSHKKAMGFIKKINNYEYDILIGTQIISKGYHFPLLTFVGIIDADFNYSLDMKSNERAWQVLYQVSGRAGREKLVGSIMLQTYNPESTLVQSLLKGDYDLFLAEEINMREKVNFPPFGRLAGIIVSSKNQKHLDIACEHLEKSKPVGIGFEIFGSVNAPIYILRGNYRKRFLVKTNLNINLQLLIKKWIESINLANTVSLQIDIDPMSFY